MLNNYNPFQWPPDLELAKLHYQSSKSGTDKPDGRKCPCCSRQEKQSNTNWYSRNIREDYKNFGGGIPGYFYLLIYIMTVIIILGGVNVVYHIMLLDQVCPTLAGTPDSCALVFGVFYFCEHDVLINTLNAEGFGQKATIQQFIQLTTYVILILATLGMKVFFYLVGSRKGLDKKLFSHFALVIKNVPLYYQLQDLQAQLKKIEPSLEIVQMFYLHKVCAYENTVRSLIDLYFQMNDVEKYLRVQNSQRYQQQSRKMKEKYLELYQQYQKEALNLRSHSKKIIVVFNTIKQKEKIHSALSLNKFSKYFYYFFKMLGWKRESIGYFSQRLAEPQQTYWKYIGEGSTQKEKLRAQAVLICISFVLISFGVMYFPMLAIDKQKILDPGLGTGLGVMVSLIVVTLFLIIRALLFRLLPLRRPSNKLAQGYFIVITIAVFFFAFYIISPAAFYFFTNPFSKNIKLGTFFISIMVFCISTIVVNWVDVGYRMFKHKKDKLLNDQKEANKYCQGRLHEQVTPPPFPISFYLVVAFNIWSFNSYYIFEMPQLLPLFFFVLFFIYWLSKYTLYNHYRTQSYLSLQLQDKTQKVVLFIFLICVSLGYFGVSQFAWQKFLILCVFVGSICLNIFLEYLFKRKKAENIEYNTDIKGAMEKCIGDPQAVNILNVREADIKASFAFTEAADVAIELSAASQVPTIASCGYLETYNLYLGQFQKKQINELLEARHLSIKATHTSISFKRESELAKLFGQSLHQALLNSEAQQIYIKPDQHKRSKKNSEQFQKGLKQTDKILEKSQEQSSEKSKQNESLSKQQNQNQSNRLQSPQILPTDKKNQ